LIVNQAVFFVCFVSSWPSCKVFVALPHHTNRNPTLAVRGARIAVGFR
jgi:hypothetical protein